MKVASSDEKRKRYRRLTVVANGNENSAADTSPPRVAKHLLELNGEFVNASNESLAALLCARFVVRARKHSGLTQTELAERLAIGQSRVSKMENITTDSELKVSTLVRLAEVCGGTLKLEFEPKS